MNDFTHRLCGLIMKQSGHILDNEDSPALNAISNRMGAADTEAFLEANMTMSEDERTLNVALLCAAADMGPNFNQMRQDTIGNLSRIPKKTHSKYDKQTQFVLSDLEGHSTGMVLITAVNILVDSQRPELDRVKDHEVADNLVKLCTKWADVDPKLAELRSSLQGGVTPRQLMGVALHMAWHVLQSADDSA